MEKCICLKEEVSFYGKLKAYYISFPFKKGNIYYFSKVDNNYCIHFNHEHVSISIEITESNFNEGFIDIHDWRDNQINKLYE